MTTEQIREAILANYSSNGIKRMKWRELALQLQIPMRTLSYNLSVLRNAGKLPDQKKRTGLFERRHSARKDALDGITRLKGAQTREERISILADIAQNGSDRDKIAAIEKLEEMEHAAGLQYGPPPPTTKDDTIKLVIELLSSVRKDWVREAIELYENAQNPPENPETVPVNPSNSDVGGREP